MKNFNTNSFEHNISVKGDLCQTIMDCLNKWDYKAKIAEINDALSKIEKIDKIDITTQDENGDTLLHLLVKKNCCKTLGLLITKGLEISNDDLNAKNYDGQTPLHIAAGLDYKSEMLEILLKVSNVQNLSQKNEEGNTPLHIIANHTARNKDVYNPFGALKKNNININDIEWNAKNKVDRTIFHMTIHGGNFDMFKSMLEEDTKMDVNHKGCMDNNALHIVATYDMDKRFLGELLKRDDIDINAKNCFGETPLDVAIAALNRKVIEAIFTSNKAKELTLDTLQQAIEKIQSEEIKPKYNPQTHEEILSLLQAALLSKQPESNIINIIDDHNQSLDSPLIPPSSIQK